MKHITTFEHCVLLKQQDIPNPCFEWLITQNLKSLKLTTYNGKLCFKTQNLVGVIATPFGTQIEILPKVFSTFQDSATEIAHTRYWFSQILNQHYIHLGRLQKTTALQAKGKQTTPIHIWLIQQYLNQCEQVFNHGLTTDYHTQQQNDAYLRGKLNIADNIRQNQAKLKNHHFAQTTQTRQTENAENRIIGFALLALAVLNLPNKAVLNHPNLNKNHNLQNTSSKLDHQFYKAQKLLKQMNTNLLPIHQLSIQNPHNLFHYVKNQFIKDLQLIQKKRLPKPYQNALPMAQMILDNINQAFGTGQNHGMSLLFNMHSLFEKMIESTLKKTLDMKTNALTIDTKSCRLISQPNHKAMLHNYQHLHHTTDADFFKLRPDFILQTNTEEPTPLIIIDAKWKQLTSPIIRSISQSDIYQMFAYASHYFNDEFNTHENQAEIWLIYPKTQSFSHAEYYRFKQLHIPLKILPFDLENQTILFNEVD